MRDIEMFDDGDGPAIFGIGPFTNFNGDSSFWAAVKWSGRTWTPVVPSAGPPANALAVFDDGTGPALFFGGELTDVAGTPPARLVKRYRPDSCP